MTRSACGSTIICKVVPVLSPSARLASHCPLPTALIPAPHDFGDKGAGIDKQRQQQHDKLGRQAHPTPKIEPLALGFAGRQRGRCGPGQPYRLGGQVGETKRAILLGRPLGDDLVLRPVQCDRHMGQRPGQSPVPTCHCRCGPQRACPNPRGGVHRWWSQAGWRWQPPRHSLPQRQSPAMTPANSPLPSRPLWRSQQALHQATATATTPPPATTHSS
jgi:hypothetical protein